MKYLIAIDPGARSGFALFEGRLLTTAAAGPVPKSLDIIDRVSGPVRAVIERPQWFGKRNEDQLIELAIRAGEWAQLLRALLDAEVEFVKPAKWKGSVPKDIHHRRLLAKLSVEEKDVLPFRPKAKDYDHNMLDAVGIGLWALGRMRR